MTSFFNKIETGEVQKNVLINLKGITFLNELLEYFGIRNVNFIADNLSQYDKKEEEYEQLISVQNWLKGINVRFSITELAPFDAELPLSQMNELINNFKHSLNFDNQTTEALTFFVSKKSALFESLSRDYRKNLKGVTKNFLFLKENNFFVLKKRV